MAPKKPLPPPSSAQRESPQAWKELSPQDVPRPQLFPWAGRDLQPPSLPHCGAEQPVLERDASLSHRDRKSRALAARSDPSVSKPGPPTRRQGERGGRKEESGGPEGPWLWTPRCVKTELALPVLGLNSFMSHVGTVVSGTEVDLGIPTPGFCFQRESNSVSPILCVCASVSPL